LRRTRIADLVGKGPHPDGPDARPGETAVDALTRRAGLTQLTGDSLMS
jgi:hypothetical protein